MPVFHPDVRVCEVTDASDGSIVGLLYFDTYARAGKRSGAWMTPTAAARRLRGDDIVLSSNNNNFVKRRPASRC